MNKVAKNKKNISIKIWCSVLETIAHTGADWAKDTLPEQRTLLLSKGHSSWEAPCRMTQALEEDWEDFSEGDAKLEVLWKLVPYQHF